MLLEILFSSPGKGKIVVTSMADSFSFGSHTRKHYIKKHQKIYFYYGERKPEYLFLRWNCYRFEKSRSPDIFPVRYLLNVFTIIFVSLCQKDSSFYKFMPSAPVKSFPLGIHRLISEVHFKGRNYSRCLNLKLNIKNKYRKMPFLFFGFHRFVNSFKSFFYLVMKRRIVLHVTKLKLYFYKRNELWMKHYFPWI